MKWQWLVPVILTVVVVCIISWPQLDHFADINTMAAQRQQLGMEGERRYNDFARMQAPNVKLSADDVADALGQIVPVNTTKRGESLMSTLGLGLFGPADDGSNKQGDGVERTGVLQEKINFCESITSTNCDTLDDPRYSECGICHKNGMSSKGKKHRGGMYISADDQIRANEEAKAKGTRAMYKPTIGGCDPDSFTVMKETCVAKGRQLDCQEAGAPSTSNECGQCYGGSGALMYVGPKPKKFTAVLNVSHPGYSSDGSPSFVFVNNTTKSGRQTLPSGKKDTVLDPKKMYLELIEGENIKLSITNMPRIWCAWLSSPDGKRTVSIDVGVNHVEPQNAIVIAGDKNSSKINKPMSAVSGWNAYKATVPSTVMWYMLRSSAYVPPSQPSECQNLGYPSSDNRIRLYDRGSCSTIGGTYYPGGECLRKGGGSYSWDCRTLNDPAPQPPPVSISVMIPATLADPFYDVDVTECPAGPLNLTAAGAGLMGANSCYNAKGQFNPTVYCLTQLFEAAGGTSAGTLYPDTPEKARALVVNNSLDATIDSINNMANSALYGIDNNDAPVGFAAQKDLALKMLGLTLNNPCDGPTSKTGPHSAACIDYLWRTSGNSAPLGTNVDPASLPYAYCHADGAAAPLRRSATIQAANSVGDIQSIRNSFYSIFTRAQDSSDFDAQAAAMKACYGVNINKPSTPPPVCPPPKVSINGSHTVVKANGRTYYTITGSATFSMSSTENVEYFAIGGAGGSGAACGGGAGGVQTNAGVHAFASQVAPITFTSGDTYTVAIGAGGTPGRNGGDTTITGTGTTIRALGGAMGGASGSYCPAANGGSGGGGGGCASTGLQGGSTNIPPSSPIANAGAGAGGPPTSYSNGGPGIRYNGNMYGVASPNSSATSTGAANTGNAGANGGAGGSGVVILSVPSA